MAEPRKSTGWWQTLPGLLTALAAILTAITGFAALLFQHGVFGGKRDVAVSVQSSARPYASSAPAPDRAAPAPGRPAPTKSWSDATAVVTRRDGTTARLRAASLSNCISVAHDIQLEAGQSIPFEKMSRLVVIQADDPASPSPRAKVEVRLLDGTVVSGSVEANCDLFGYNSVGRVTMHYDHIRSIDFE